MTLKPCANKARLPQRARARREALPAFRLTARDRAGLLAVYTYRALTPQQFSDLLFVPPPVLRTPLPSSRCLHRLKLLYQYGLLERHEIPHTLSEGRKPFVYRLAAGGAEVVALALGLSPEELDWRPGEKLSALFLNHLIAVNDVVVACARSAQRHGFSIERYLDDRTLKRYRQERVTLTSATGRTQRAAVVPDGYVHLLAEGSHYHHFLEVDLQTVTGASAKWGRRTWARKVITYLTYYRSGKYHARYQTKSLRVLTVTTGEKRLAHLKTITEASGGAARFWFTTLESVRTADVLVDPIWQVANRQGLHRLTW